MLDAQELIDDAIPRGRRGVILRGDFGRLVPIGITKEQLRRSNFITDGASNAPPIALDDFTSTSENTSVNISVLDNDFDFDNDPVSIIGFDSRSSEGGTIVLSDSGDDFLIYTPSLGFAGSDSFSYTISDGLGNTDTASVSVTVRSGQTPPPPPPPPPLLPTSVSLARQDQLTGMSASDMLVGNENEDISSDAIEGL